MIVGDENIKFIGQPRSTRHAQYVLFVLALLIAGCSDQAAVHELDNSRLVRDSEIDRYPSWDELPDTLREAYERDFASLPPDSAYERNFDAVGPVAMLDFLESSYPRCHSQAHELGSVIYSRLGSLGEALMTCGDRCTNACMHGVVRAAFGGTAFEDVTARIGEICDLEEMITDARPGACAHAFGHAFMVTTDYSIDKSLEGCALFESRFDDYRCANGVFMEYQGMVASSERAGSPIQRPRPRYPCDENPKYAVACYRYMLTRTIEKPGFGTKDMVEECLSLAGQFRLGCFHGLGLAMAGPIFENPQKLADVCSAGNEQDQTLCIEGIVENLSIHDKDKAHEACMFVSENLRTMCSAAADSGYYRQTKPTLPLYLPTETIG